MALAFKDATSYLIMELVNYLTVALASSYVDVKIGWPRPDTDISLPSLSVVASRPEFHPCKPYVLSTTDNGDHEVDALIKFGAWEVPLQLDIWGSSRTNRGAIWEAVMAAWYGIEGVTSWDAPKSAAMLGIMIK